jgi:hypothetical protein
MLDTERGGSSREGGDVGRRVGLGGECDSTIDCARDRDTRQASRLRYDLAVG